jgi:hypothetical protein
MAKEPAGEFTRSQRGSQYDVVKPIGWMAPETEIARVLGDCK